jgi:hypothetical protein
MKIKILSVFVIGIMAVSCQDEYLINQTRQNSADSQRFDYVKSRSMLSDEEYLHLLQSDKMNMIIDRISYSDSAYVLNLTHEEAIILGIPDSLYIIATDIVTNYNTQNN